MRCTKCGTEFNSPFCPSCGTNPLTSKKKKPKSSCGAMILTVVLVFVGIFVLGGILGGILSNKPAGDVKTTPKPVDYVFEDIMDLLKKFSDNKVNANNKYSGKLVQVTGVIDEIKRVKDFTLLSEDDSPVIIIKCIDENFDVYAATFYFNNQSEINKVLNLKIGDTVTIVGTMEDYEQGISLGDYVFVNFKKCLVVKTERE